MTGASIDLISAGHMCVDIAPRFLQGAADGSVERVFRPGRLTVVGPAVVSAGGGAANVGLAVQRLGLNVSLMGKCGDDLLGQTLLAVLERAGPQCAAGMRTSSGEHTGYTVALAVPGVDRIFLHFPGANDTFTAADIDLELVGAARLLYFGYPPLMASMYADNGSELASLLAGVKGRGVTTALDMALPDPAGEAAKADWQAILAAALPNVDVFAPSVEELTFMLRRDEYDQLTAEGDILDRLTPALLRELADRCLSQGAAVAAVKCGRHGVYVRSGPAERIAAMGSAAPDPAGWADREIFAPAYRVDRVVSATGAGDSAVAGLLAALLRGTDLPTAADCACAVGAQNVRAVDPVSGVQSWEQTIAQLSAPRVPPAVVLD